MRGLKSFKLQVSSSKWRQFMAAQTNLSLTPRFSAVKNPGRIKNRFNGFTVLVCALHPESR
jgi:hypothetical protein